MIRFLVVAAPSCCWIALTLTSMLAINPDKGELVWQHQTTPGDTWEYTAVQPMHSASADS